MEITLEDDHFIVSFFANFVNAAEKVYDENNNLIKFKKIGELMLEDSPNYNNKEELIRMAEFCIKLCSRNKVLHRFSNPIIKNTNN